MQKEEIVKEFEEKYKEYFAIESMRCKKCGHLKDSHWWNGGGSSENSGYDRCREKDCKCIDYDENKDFEVVIVSYEKGYEEIKNFWISKLLLQRQEIAERVSGMTLTVYRKGENSEYVNETASEYNQAIEDIINLILQEGKEE